MRNSSGFYPRLRVDAASRATVSHAGSVLLLETVRATGLDRLLSMALVPWRKPLARHNPAKVLVDLAVALALGADCLADVALLRAAPELFGPVASDPTVSRTIDALAADSKALTAIATARAAARAASWRLAGTSAPNADVDASRPLVVDLGATLVGAHSEKEGAAPTFKRGFGHHPLLAFADHGPGGWVSRWRCCSGPVTPGRTPPLTTSPSPGRRWRSFPVSTRCGRDGGCWSAPMARAPPTSSSTGWSGGGCPTRSASPCRPGQSS